MLSDAPHRNPPHPIFLTSERVGPVPLTPDSAVQSMFVLKYLLKFVSLPGEGGLNIQEGAASTNVP